MRNNDFNNVCETLKLEDIGNMCSELEQLESVMYLLNKLLGWCEVCINNKQEELDFKLLQKAYETLEEVHKNYLEKY